MRKSVLAVSLGTINRIGIEELTDPNPGESGLDPVGTCPM